MFAKRRGKHLHKIIKMTIVTKLLVANFFLVKPSIQAFSPINLGVIDYFFFSCQLLVDRKGVTRAKEPIIYCHIYTSSNTINL